MLNMKKLTPQQQQELTKQKQSILNDPEIKQYLENLTPVQERLFDNKTFEFLFSLESKKQMLLVRKKTENCFNNYEQQKELMKKCKQFYVMNETNIIPHQNFFVLIIKAWTTLLEFINKNNQNLSYLECLRLGCNLALAVEDCHKNEIGRLSIVPDNIFLDQFNRIRLHCFAPAIKTNSDYSNSKSVPLFELYSLRYQSTIRSSEEVVKEDLEGMIRVFYFIVDSKKEECLTSMEREEIEKIKKTDSQKVSGQLSKLYISKMITSKTKPKINESISFDQQSLNINYQNFFSKDNSFAIIFKHTKSIDIRIQPVENNNINNSNKDLDNKQIKMDLMLPSDVSQIKNPKKKQPSYIRELSSLNQIFKQNEIDYVVNDFYEWALKGYCFCREDSKYDKYIALLKSESFLDSLSEKEGIIIYCSQGSTLNLKINENKCIKYDNELFQLAVNIHLKVCEIARDQ